MASEDGTAVHRKGPKWWETTLCSRKQERCKQVWQEKTSNKKLFFLSKAGSLWTFIKVAKSFLLPSLSAKKMWELHLLSYLRHVDSVKQDEGKRDCCSWNSTEIKKFIKIKLKIYLGLENHDIISVGRDFWSNPSVQRAIMKLEQVTQHNVQLVLDLLDLREIPQYLQTTYCSQ